VEEGKQDEKGREPRHRKGEKKDNIIAMHRPDLFLWPFPLILCWGVAGGMIIN
jgi:hypothetical protein